MSTRLKTKEYLVAVKTFLSKIIILFFRNTHVPCTHIPGPDLTKWQDTTCNKHDFHGNIHYNLKGKEENKNEKHRDATNRIKDYSSLFDSLLPYNNYTQQVKSFWNDAH